MFVEQHLKFFLKCPVPKEWEGQNARDWTGFVAGPSPPAPRLPGIRHKREDLRAFCIHPDTTDKQAFLAVMAWGGMHRLHGRVALANYDGFSHAVTGLRGHKDKDKDEDDRRDQSFEQFESLKAGGLRPRMRAPYFTKLLYFLRKKQDAYIMDQWSAKSVNLLRAVPLDIPFSPAGLVEDGTATETYEQFCLTIEELAKRAGCSAGEAERRLMSYGGRQPGPWRAYVKRHWRRGRNPHHVE